jgi:hypothetical protein
LPALSGSPVFSMEDANQMMEVACSRCPIRSLRLPRTGTGYTGASGPPAPWRRAYPCVGPSCPQWRCRLDWLASEARDARVAVTRRALPASGESPCHLFVTHHVLRTCLPLMTPFRARLLTR